VANYAISWRRTLMEGMNHVDSLRRLENSAWRATLGRFHKSMTNPMKETARTEDREAINPLQ
jgi:hypothetical protein